MSFASERSNCAQGRGNAGGPRRRLRQFSVLGGTAVWALWLCGCQGGLGQNAVGATTQRVAESARPRFSGAGAMDHIRTQCGFGARVPGTPAHRKARDWMVGELKKSADRVIVQDFLYRNLPLSNVIAFFNEKADRQVLLCAHWDSRPTADMEVLPAKRRMPVPGANDGASGVAVLLELARMFRATPPSVGVMMVMFDGEDYGDFERDEGVFLGSRHFAAKLKGLGSPAYGILLDMVGDRDLAIYREANSERLARRVNDLVFGFARELGHGRTFVDRVRFTISDDHLPINDAGVPCIDLIDFDYGPWHTADDTPDKCSAESLQSVGDVVAEVVYRENNAPKAK